MYLFWFGRRHRGYGSGLPAKKDNSNRGQTLLFSAFHLRILRFSVSVLTTKPSGTLWIQIVRFCRKDDLIVVSPVGV